MQQQLQEHVSEQVVEPGIDSVVDEVDVLVQMDIDGQVPDGH